METSIISTKSTYIVNGDVKHEYSYETINEKDRLCKQGSQTYSNLMNSRCSSFHIFSLVIWILSLISLQFLLMQIFIMVRPFIATNRLETITFSFLIFAALAVAWFLRTYFLENVLLKRTLLLFSLLNIILMTYIIITDSYYILYMIYPAVALFFGITFFTAKGLFEEFFIYNEYEGKTLLTDNARDLLFAIFSFSGLLVILNAFVVMPNLQSDARWNAGLIFFTLLQIAIFTLSFFVADSPLSLYRNFAKEDVMRKLAGKINNRGIEEEEWNSILADIKVIYYQREHHKLAELCGSANRKNVTFYYIVVFCVAFIFTNMIEAIPTTVYEYAKVNLQPDVPKGYMGYLSIFLFIGMFGYLIGIGMNKWNIISKKWLIVIGFSLVLVFAFIIAFWNVVSILFAGLTLCEAYMLWYLVENYGADIFTRDIHDKLKSTFLPVFFASAAISTILIEGLNDINMADSHFVMAGFAITGIVFTLLLKKN
jgi:hypothetical protein